MCSKLRVSLGYLLIVLASFGPTASAQAPDAALPAPRRVKVSEAAASAMVAERTSTKYPDAARRSGNQGLVVLKVVVGPTGKVQEVTTISGDSMLAQAAADAVMQWKYKPYMLDGAAVEMETQVSINFHLKAPEQAAPSLGTFKDETYTNEFFDFEYPLSRDWVRETQAIRKQVSATGQSPGMYVLLAAVHIPQHTAPLEADSSFVLSAINGGGQNCQQYLQSVADVLRTSKHAKEKGTITPLTVAGRDFYRADFELGDTPRHRTFLCTEAKTYLLEWNIAALSNSDTETTLSTLNAIYTVPAKATPAASNESAAGSSENSVMLDKPPQPVRVSVASGVTQGMILKRVQPIYPEQARRARIQGTVMMSAVISKSGEVTDLEVLDGPIELAVSAVNAVRQWKYRPYLMNGEPVEVNTRLVVNYMLSYM